MAEGGLFAAFGNYAQLGVFAKYAGYFILFLFVALFLTAIIMMFVVMAKSKKIIEINMVNKRVKFMRGRIKKNKAGVNMLWVGKLKKFIPHVQEEDIYTKGKQDVVILLRDNNDMHHTSRIPNYDELSEWYKMVHGVDVENVPELKKNMNTVYLLPSPSEDLDWLANQAVEANKEFAQAWWQSPTVMMVGTAAVCAFMFIITVIVTKRM